MNSTTRSVLPVAVYADLTEAVSEAVTCLQHAMTALRTENPALPFELAELLADAGHAGDRLSEALAAAEKEYGEDVWDEAAEGGAA